MKKTTSLVLTGLGATVTGIGALVGGRISQDSDWRMWC
jgi:hypothetical protein